MKKAFVTGWPIAHSKSPLLHQYWLNEYGIKGSYEALPVEPQNFKSFLLALPDSGFAGGNVTIPYKEEAFELVQSKDQTAEILGAVNTLWVEDDKVRAGNTDAYGFTNNMDEYAPGWREKENAVVLGAGGASRAVIHAILEAGFKEVHIVNRTLERAKTLADRFGGRCFSHGWHGLGELSGQCRVLVNTTSLGMNRDEEVILPELAGFSEDTIISDIVYTPLQTPLLRLAHARGLKTVDGLGMLLHQAAPGFEKWFGTRPAVSRELRNHILSSMGLDRS